MSEPEITEGIDYCRVPLDVFRAIESAGGTRRRQQLALAYMETFMYGEPREPVTKSVLPVFELLRGSALRYRKTILRNKKKARDQKGGKASPEPAPGDGQHECPPEYQTDYPPEYPPYYPGDYPPYYPGDYPPDYTPRYYESTQGDTGYLPAETPCTTYGPLAIDNGAITITNIITNTNTNTKDEGAEIEDMDPPPLTHDEKDARLSEQRAEIVAHLNETLGTRYRPNAAATRRHVDARLREGYAVEDFKTVIDFKAGEWRDDPKMRQYLRPSTLFGPKFEDYLNAATMAGKPSHDFGSWEY